MPRPSAEPTTVLAAAVQAKRAGRAQRAIQDESGIAHTTLSRIERGASKPSAETARALARWLGWTIEEVLDAAETLTEIR